LLAETAKIVYDILAYKGHFAMDENNKIQLFEDKATVQTLTVIASEAKQSSGSWIAAVAALPRNDGIPASV
jgi:hypothetical protein